MWNSFSCAHLLFVCHLCGSIFSCLLPIFYWIVCFLFYFFSYWGLSFWILYIPDTSPLLSIWSAVFSCTLWLVFFILRGSFAEQIYFDEVTNLLIFPFVDHGFGVKYKNSLPNPSGEFYPLALISLGQGLLQGVLTLSHLQVCAWRCWHDHAGSHRQGERGALGRKEE